MWGYNSEVTSPIAANFHSTSKIWVIFEIPGESTPFPESLSPCRQEDFPKQERTGMQGQSCSLMLTAFSLGHVFHILSHFCYANTRVASLTGGSPAGTVGFNPLSRTMPIWNSWKLELGSIKVVKVLFLMAPSLGPEPPSGGKLWGWGSVNGSRRYYNSVEHMQIVKWQKIKQGKMSNNK